MMTDMERFFSKWGPPFGTHPERYRDFHEQSFLPDWYAMPAGRATEIYHTYWEEPFHPDGEFGPDDTGFGLRTATAAAKGRGFYRPLAFSAGTGNSDLLVLNGWQRPVLGQEGGLRRFAQAFRALPIDADPRYLETEPDTTEIHAAWYGDRIGVVNQDLLPRSCIVVLDEALVPGIQLRDIVSGAVVLDAKNEERDRFPLHLDGYDLRTLLLEHGE